MTRAGCAGIPDLRRLLARLAPALLAAFIAATVGAQGTSPVPAGTNEAAFAMAQRLYREGLGASGEPLSALGPAQTRLSGKEAACVTCHRRSGYGTSEGRYSIRPIIGPALLQEQTVPAYSPRIKARLGSSQRPPYTEALLARALRSGLDAAGKPLDPVMPRYNLSDAELKALSTYLFTLGAKPSPGVDEEEIHFATVIQPGVSPARRRAMLDIMETFVRDKGANVRQDEQRRDAGVMRMYRAYRKWVLHVWELSGPSETWGAQLEGFYKQQAVFALVGGLGTQSWGPIHDFSERFEIPSVFPLVDLPVQSGVNQYNFYLSRGVALEAEVLARFLRDKGAPGKLVQVRRGDGADAAAGAAAAAALRAGLQIDAGQLEERVLDGPADAAFWRSINDAKPAAVVLWLGASDLEAIPSAAGDAGSPAIYLSSWLLKGRLPEAAVREGANVRLVYPSDLPPRREARLLRNKIWLHNKGIAITDETVQINTQFAMAVLSDTVGHMLDSFSRDYFVERLEHVVSQTPIASMYQSVSLGPGQRFAAKGSSVVQLTDADNKMQLKPLSGWIVP